VSPAGYVPLSLRPAPPAARFRLVALGALLWLCACGVSGPARPGPQPSVASAAGNLSCPGSDHGLQDEQMGWGFCYPATWKYIERVQPSTAPVGADTTFDIVVDAPSPRAGADQGLFGFMIIGTYELGGATSLSQWTATNLGPGWSLSPITWGNALEADVASGPRTVRLARTPHHVVLLDLRSGQGNLDLDQAMGSRLGSWRFSY